MLIVSAHRLPSALRYWSRSTFLSQKTSSKSSAALLSRPMSRLEIAFRCLAGSAGRNEMKPFFSTPSGTVTMTQSASKVAPSEVVTAMGDPVWSIAVTACPRLIVTPVASTSTIWR